MTDLLDSFFVDVSRWQGKINWEITQENIVGAYVKATDGTSWVDPRFYENRDALNSLGIPWGSYSFYQPLQPYREQVLHYLKQIAVLDPNSGLYKINHPLVPAIDVEKRVVGYPKSKYYEGLSGWLRYFFVLTGVYPIIYTSKAIWESILPLTDFAKNHWLWVAHYNRYITHPAIPVDWAAKGYKIWQWSADGNLLGAFFGAQSKSIDLNRYNGGLVAFSKDYPNISVDVPDDDNDTNGDEEQPQGGDMKTYTAQVNLNVRDKPTVTGSRVWFTVPVGTEITALEEVESGADIWLRVGIRQYVAKMWQGKIFLK